MKLKLLFLLVLLPLIGFSQDKINYSTLPKEDMKTSILIEEFSPFSPLKSKTEQAGMFSLQQAYKELSKADAANRFSDLELLNSSMRINSNNETIKIGGIHSSFETVSKEALTSGNVIIDNQGNLSRHTSDYIFETYTRTIIAPLTVNKKGLKTTFYLDSNLFVNTTEDEITSIEVDFGDNIGFIAVPFNTVITITYPDRGKKELVFKLNTDNGSSISKAILNILYSRDDYLQMRNANQLDIFASIAPDLSIYPSTDAFAGMAEYEIFLGADGVLDKPIIVVDGFDPSDTRDINAVYDLLTFTDASNTTQNLGDLIRNDEDFDVIILNFPQYLKLTDNSLLNIGDVTDTNGDTIIDENDYPSGSVLIDGGADYIERNAMTLVELINTINSQKTGSEQNVIIGPSMGGLISRYALTYMEQNALNHDTRLWISFDSPHYGANVPVSLQLLFNYFGYGYGDVDSVKLLVEGFLRSPAARQMLVDHFDAHMDASIPIGDDPVSPAFGFPYLPTGAPGYRDPFQNRMNAIGFPTTTRNVSMINGSGIAAAFQDIGGNDIQPGFDLIDSNIDTGDVIIFINTRADTFCEYMPNAGVQKKIVDVAIQAQIIFWLTQDTFEATAESHSFTDGVDSAPGGLFDIFALGDSLGGDPVLTNFLAAMQAGYFSFIPTTSAMGLANQQDYYAIPDPNNGDSENITPFDAWYMPDANEPHVTLTDANVSFALNEIIPSTLSSEEFVDNTIALEKNPIDNHLVILSNTILPNATLTISDTTGKLVYNATTTLQNRTELNINAAPGLYILNITADNGNNFTIKVVIK